VNAARPSERYERSDAHARPLFLFGLVLALLIAGALAASAWIGQDAADALQAGEQASPVRDLRKAPEGPALQAVPARELALHRAREEHLLESIEWVDAVNGVVRIPIERAMELTLAEGLPARAEEHK